jgi:uncharacterized protein (TIGR02186 family)
MKIFLVIFIVLILNKNIFATEAYFELSEREIKIQTDFIGKEIIIFGIYEKGEETIILIEGPKKNTKVMKKERILGFWFNTKKVIYQNLPSLVFLASSAPIKEILSQETIIKENLYFDALVNNVITQRNFIDQNSLKKWNKNLINIKKNNNLFKEYEFTNIENKLFQSQIFFPSNSIPGEYKVTIYQVKNKLITGKKHKVINIKKSGIGEKIFKFAHNQPATYGLLSIIFAVLSGLFAATLFRRI